jgi:hypothetical protein
MRAWIALIAIAAMLGATAPAAAQGPVNPREPSTSGGGSGGDRAAEPRGGARSAGRPSGDGGSSGAPRATTPPQAADGARTAVPRNGPPPDRDRGGRIDRDDRTLVVAPGGGRYVYRGRYYPFYPYGTRGAFSGPYWYPPHYGVTVQRYVRPNGPRYGELRLRVRPREAEVYVDGYYAGRVDDFDGTFQSLRLTPGPHAIEIIAPGYEVLEFQVGPAARGKITYEGDLIPF